MSFAVMAGRAARVHGPADENLERLYPMNRRASITLLCLAPLLVFSIACGASGSDDESPPAPAVEVAPPPPAPPAPPAPAAPAANTLSVCMERCQAEHGPLMDRARMASCARAGNPAATCVSQAINRDTNRCQRTCRGLTPDP